MFYKKTYNTKKTDKTERQDSTEDLLEDLGNEVERVRRNSLKVKINSEMRTLYYNSLCLQRLLKECGEILSQLLVTSEETPLEGCLQF